MISAVQSTDPWEQRWPREQYPALYLPPDEYREHLRRDKERQHILDVIGDDITDIALAVFREASQR
jgi:hypothetical protein